VGQDMAGWTTGCGERDFRPFEEQSHDTASLSNIPLFPVEDRGEVFGSAAWGLRWTGLRRFRDSCTIRETLTALNAIYEFLLEDHSGVCVFASPLGSGLTALDLKTNIFTRYSFIKTRQQSVGREQPLRRRGRRALGCTMDRGCKLHRRRNKFIR
jgi:hypothetical protein